MSFWVVPIKSLRLYPRIFAILKYIDKTGATVNGSTMIATLTLSMGISFARANKLSIQYKGTPDVPTSGAPSALVGSIPLNVSASTAALNPVSPFSYKNFHLRFVSSGDMVFNRKY